MHPVRKGDPDQLREFQYPKQSETPPRMKPMVTSTLLLKTRFQKVGNGLNGALQREPSMALLSRVLVLTVAWGETMHGSRALARCRWSFHMRPLLSQEGGQLSKG